MSEHPLVDFQALEGLKHFAENDPNALLLELIELYLNQSTLDVKAVQTACNENKYPEMAALAHRLKSSSLQMGVIAVAKKAEMIERSHGQLSTQACVALVTGLVDDFEKSKAILNDYFKKLKI